MITGSFNRNSADASAALSRLEKFASAVLVEASKETNTASQEIIADAQKLAPVDTGALQSTGQVFGEDWTPSSVETTMGFGGFVAGPLESTKGRGTKSNINVSEYAFQVHFDPSQPNRLFLEQPFKAKRDPLTKRLLDKLKGVIVGFTGP